MFDECRIGGKRKAENAGSPALSTVTYLPSHLSALSAYPPSLLVTDPADSAEMEVLKTLANIWRNGPKVAARRLFFRYPTHPRPTPN
jgi:hypothetical protein